MQKVLVFGRDGQLASELRTRTGETDSFVYLGKDQIPAGDPSALSELIERHQPTVIVNCAAYTAVDRAESDQDACFQLNRDFVTELSRLSTRSNAHLVHFSTDYVFNGEHKRPYIEEDATGPVNVYGVSKLAGEHGVLAHAKRATIIRTSWVYSKFGANFVKSIVRLANGDKPLKVVADQYGTPTAASELAEFVLTTLLERESYLSSLKVSLFHFSGEGETTWNGFAREIARLWRTKQQDLAKITTSEYPTAARRPAYGVLSKEKIKREFDIDILPWQKALQKNFENWGQA